MSYRDVYESTGIKDYITLGFNDYTTRDSDFIRTYDIPSSAYLSQNGSEYCLVSCTNFDVIFQGNKRPFILEIEGVQNSYRAAHLTSAGRGLIANVQAPNNGSAGSKYAHRFGKNTLQFKMRARPSQIKIHSYTYNSSGRLIVKNISGSFTLCFEYLSRKKVLDQEVESSYTPAF
tara:strand:- start:22 stop:546 length:525 start_codon:yes stop_codon:yes gene_type:complete